MTRYLKRSAAIAAAIAITATPALAANGAASLSVAKSARAGTLTTRGSKVAAGPTATLLNVGILAALVGGVLLATTGGDDKAASN